MIAITYTEFCFSECGHSISIRCTPVQNGSSGGVSPTVKRIGIPANGEAIVPPNQGGAASSEQSTNGGTSNGVNDQGGDSATLKDASGKEVRVLFGLVQVDFTTIKAMKEPEALVASGMLSKVPVKKTGSSLTKGEVDISISPDCETKINDILNVSNKNIPCSTLVNTAHEVCEKNASYNPEAKKELVKTVIDTFNDICFSRRPNSGAPRLVR